MSTRNKITERQEHMLLDWLEVNNLDEETLDYIDYENGVRVFAKSKNTEEPWEIDFIKSQEQVDFEKAADELAEVLAKAEEVGKPKFNDLAQPKMSEEAKKVMKEALDKSCEDQVKIMRNAFRCRKCGMIVESKSVHDFQTCKCGNFTDGGLDYVRRGGNIEDMEDLSEPHMYFGVKK